jgi:hypothetical protein
LPSDTEERLGEFAELVATAIANAVARDELQANRDKLAQLADLQAALRRVATLVARGVPASELFSTVAEELARALDAWLAAVRFRSTLMLLLSADCLIPWRSPPITWWRRR